MNKLSNSPGKSFADRLRVTARAINKLAVVAFIAAIIAAVVWLVQQFQ